MTLTEFLLARIAEAKENAAALQRRAQEHELDCQDPKVLGTVVPGWGDWPAVQKIASRVLARCEADRRVVERCRASNGYWGAEVERMLASAYADHPDYDETWKL